MDEVFWSNVVKRWSDASENVITLKKELAQVKEERALYRSLVHNLRRNDVTRDLRQSEHILEEHIHPVQVSHTEEEIDATIRDELQDAEAGLYRAKEEYKRLQIELATSLDQVKALTAENDRLTITHRQEMEKLQEEMQNLLARKSQVVGSSSSDPLSRKAILSLERQVETLTLSVEEYKTDNQQLQDELSATQSRLHKAEENSKALLSSIVKLQDIARHSGILRPLSNLSQYSESRRSSRKLSMNSINEPLHRETKSANPPVETTRPPQDLVNSQTQIEDETMIVEEHVPALLCLLPPERQKTVDKFPPSTVPTIDPTKNRFTRDFLKVALGEEVQSLMKYLPNDRTDKKAIASSYLCPTLNHHPWCPTHPGQHGFIFVGLGKEKDTYKTPATRNLFVGLPKDKDHSKGRTFRYLGKYKVNRVNPLSIPEWNSLPDDIQLMYSKLTKDKNHNTRSPEAIKLAYDAGEMAVPCVQLQFISFDELIYSALLSYRNSIQRNKLKEG